MRSRLSRAILVLHRYLGVLVGVLMTVWCLSGFVMMYQGYPSVTEEEHRASLRTLDLSGPLALADLPIDGEEEVRRFRLEMLQDTPVLRLGGGRGEGPAAYDLRTGEQVAELSPDEVLAVARQFAAGNGLDASRAAQPQLMDSLDQWTIQSFRSAQPLYRVELGDSAGSVLYVSGASGTVVQDTNRKERVLNWLGAIPHWLYPTVLRENGPLWTEVVIWTSVIGTFLTVTGLYVGIGRFTRRNGRISPYRGLWYWHHMLGLALGLITLTWVFSGLMTMNPWGMLSGRPNELRQEISGTATWAQARDLIEQAGRNGLPEGTVQLRPTVLGGQLYALAQAPDGSTVRLDGQGRPAQLAQTEVRDALGGLPIARFEHMTGEDAYYYSFKDRKAPPAYRAILDDEQRTRIYIDASTGEISRIVDDAARQSRWLRNGLHSLDFIRGRPLWDILTLILLAGVTAVCATGAWMSIRRVGRDYKMFRRRLRKAKALIPAARGEMANR